MSNANDNQISRSSKVRNGFLGKWEHADLSKIPDKKLESFASARSQCSAAANRFMVLAVTASLLYVLRVLEVADELVVGSFKLGDLPFGLFALALSGLLLSTISLIRTGDARSFDRQLRLICDEKHANSALVEYSTYPNENAWGVAFSKMAAATDIGCLLGTIRLLSLLAINLFLLALILTPAAVALDFLLSSRHLENPTFQYIQIGTIIFFFLTNIFTFVLISSLQIIDRD